MVLICLSFLFHTGISESLAVLYSLSVYCQYKYIPDEGPTIIFCYQMICKGKIQAGKESFYTLMKTILILTSVPALAVVSSLGLYVVLMLFLSLLTSLEQFLIHICSDKITISPSEFI